jgi:hypothetical protein
MSDELEPKAQHRASEVLSLLELLRELSAISIQLSAKDKSQSTLNREERKS